MVGGSGVFAFGVELGSSERVGNTGWRLGTGGSAGLGGSGSLFESSSLIFFCLSERFSMIRCVKKPVSVQEEILLIHKSFSSWSCINSLVVNKSKPNLLTFNTVM